MPAAGRPASMRASVRPLLKRPWFFFSPTLFEFDRRCTCAAQPPSDEKAHSGRRIASVRCPASSIPARLQGALQPCDCHVQTAWAALVPRPDQTTPGPQANPHDDGRCRESVWQIGLVCPIPTPSSSCVPLPPPYRGCRDATWSGSRRGGVVSNARPAPMTVQIVLAGRHFARPCDATTEQRGRRGAAARERWPGRGREWYVECERAGRDVGDDGVSARSDAEKDVMSTSALRSAVPAGGRRVAFSLQRKQP